LNRYFYFFKSEVILEKRGGGKRERERERKKRGKREKGKRIIFLTLT